MEKTAIEHLFPEAGLLKTNGENVTATLVDEELDPFECTFNYDGCVEINTSKTNYLTLSMTNLEQLLNLIGEADEYFEQHFDSLDDE